MKTKRCLMQSASILSYVTTLIHLFVAAWFFATRGMYIERGIGSDGVFIFISILFVMLAVVSLYVGFVFNEYKSRKEYTKQEKIWFFISFGFACVSNIIVAGLALTAYLLKPNNNEPEVQKLEFVIKEVSEEDKARKKKKLNRTMAIVFAVSLCFVFFGSFFAMIFNTSGFSVRVNSINLPVNDGQWIAADLYKPKAATKDNKMPAIVIVPGFQRTKETMAQYCIELSRRGAVVIVIDPSAQGDSSSSNSSQAATSEGYGLFATIDYLYKTDNINYIDKNRIGAMGHSAGGNAVHKAALKYSQDNDYKTNPLKAIYVSGYIKDFIAANAAAYRCNVGWSYARYDEGAYRNRNKQDGNTEYHDSDLAHAQEALWLVNNVNGINTSNLTEVEMDYLYGNPYNGTMRILHNELTNHCFQPYHNESIGNVIDFFNMTLEMNSEIMPTSQIWWGKEIFNLLALIGAFMFIVPFAWLLLKIPFFKTIVKEKPDKLPAQTVKDKMVFWTILLVSALIACLDFIPLARLSTIMFPEANVSQLTWNFPHRMTNAVLLWAVVNGLIGLALYFGMYFLYGRKHHSKEQIQSLKLNWSDLGKTLLLALTVFASFYLLVETCYWLFHNDFRFMFISARILNPQMLLISLMYIPFFFIFYLSNSIRVNLSMRFKNWAEWKTMLVAGVANSIGLLFILVIQYFAFFSTGVVYYGNYMGVDVWLFINMVFGLIPMMFMLPIFNRLFYKLTGRVYLGAMVTCFIFIMMTMTNAVCYFPII